RRKAPRSSWRSRRESRAERRADAGRAQARRRAAWDLGRDPGALRAAGPAHRRTAAPPRRSRDGREALCGAQGEVLLRRSRERDRALVPERRRRIHARPRALVDRGQGLNPRRDRPQLPKGYLSKSTRGMLEWSDVERILRGGRFYWISTTDEDGRPHLVQQWAAWVDDHLYFEGSERTHWAQNLARDARV